MHEYMQKSPFSFIILYLHILEGREREEVGLPHTARRSSLRRRRPRAAARGAVPPSATPAPTARPPAGASPLLERRPLLHPPPWPRARPYPARPPGAARGGPEQGRRCRRGSAGQGRRRGPDVEVKEMRRM